MAYEFSFEVPFELLPALQAALGVDEYDLTDDVILTPTVAGAAELALLKHLPDVATFLAAPTTAELDKMRVGLALVNFMAYYVYPAIRVRVLQSESDNKSIATRFKDALNRDRNEFLLEAAKYIDELGTVDETGGNVQRIEMVSPRTDVVTGN